MEVVLFVGLFCFVPLALLTFGFWLGRGAPGFPVKLAWRADRGQDDYYEEEDHPIYARQKVSSR